MDITYSSFISKAIQGVGAGTIQALSSIIITDLVPLRERGVYAGITGVYVSQLRFILAQ
jgi:MFS family permease